MSIDYATVTPEDTTKKYVKVGVPMIRCKNLPLENSAKIRTPLGHEYTFVHESLIPVYNLEDFQWFHKNHRFETMVREQNIPQKAYEKVELVIQTISEWFAKNPARKK